MTIRNYEPADREKVAALWLTSTIKAHPFIAEDYWVNAYRTVYHDMLPMVTTLLAEVDGVIEGFLSFSAPCEIAALFVGPSCQGKGHGTALLDAAKQQYPILQLKVYAQNEKALQFYQKNGFTIVQKQVDPATGCEELVLNWHKAGAAQP